MADDADRADKRIAEAIQMAVEAAQRLANEPVKYQTSCSWCGDDTEGGARYCCKDCATDHMRYNSARRRNGVETGD